MPETAVRLVAAAFSAGAALLISNKLGKHETAGRGFRDAIAEAVAMDVPVLAGLNTGNREAFEILGGGMAIRLSSDPVAQIAWEHGVTAPAAVPA